MQKTLAPRLWRRGKRGSRSGRDFTHIHTRRPRMISCKYAAFQVNPHAYSATTQIFCSRRNSCVTSTFRKEDFCRQYGAR